jgi:hypothetical protein
MQHQWRQSLTALTWPLEPRTGIARFILWPLPDLLWLTIVVLYTNIIAAIVLRHAQTGLQL